MYTTQSLNASRPAPLISVVINNYNYAAYLQECIQSVKQQQNVRLEIVFVDDGSTDSSVGVASRLLDPEQILAKRNGGQASAMNIGFSKSRGDLILFLDSDDFLFPDALSVVASQWRAGLSRIHYPLRCVDAKGADLGRSVPGGNLNLSSGDLWVNFIKTGRHVKSPTSGNVFTRDVLEKVMPIPEQEFRICADAYLCLSTAKYGAAVAVERPLGAYRLHGTNNFAVGGSPFSATRLKADLRRVHMSLPLLLRLLREDSIPDPWQVILRDDFWPTRLAYFRRTGQLAIWDLCDAKRLIFYAFFSSIGQRGWLKGSLLAFAFTMAPRWMTRVLANWRL